MRNVSTALLALASGLFIAIPADRALAGSTSAPTTQPWDTYSDTWVATDGLGRTLPTFEECGPPKPEKTVGMFYYIWHDSARGVVRDNAKALLDDPDIRFTGPKGEWHWWGEPLLGYYLNSDPFVIRTHAAMLRDAGVDGIVCDVSNAFTYPDQVDAIFRTYEQMRQQGDEPLKVGFLTHSKTARTIRTLYDTIYSKWVDPDLWFLWDGKPFLMTVAADVPPELASFFTVRGSWAWHRPGGWFGDGHDRWPWIDDYPQQFGWHESPQIPEELSVAAAMHASSNIGRSFHDGQQPPLDKIDSPHDAFFAEQWKRVLDVSPSFLFITNFNEWIAQAQHNSTTRPTLTHFVGHPMGKDEAFFVDEFDPEFSRDIEPAAPAAANRGLDDNCYYQMVAGIRRYKGVRPLPKVSPRPITMTGNFSEWQNVGPEFRDAIGDPVQRDFDGFETGSHFVNHSGRNDIVAAKVSEDATNVYFYVRTAAAMTPCTDPDWMVLYLDVDHDAKTGWLGYDFVVNRAGVRKGPTTLERNIGGRYEWQTVNDAIRFNVVGNEMEICIPRAAIGLTAADATIDFKWADHCFAKGDWTDFTLNGDAAPDGRFNYRAVLP